MLQTKHSIKQRTRNNNARMTHSMGHMNRLE